MPVFPNAYSVFIVELFGTERNPMECLSQPSGPSNNGACIFNVLKLCSKQAKPLAIGHWIGIYNTRRPHQAPSMKHLRRYDNRSFLASSASL